MPGRTIPTEAELKAYLKEQSNWGRWGPDDELGTVNLITPEKRLQAAGLVKSGRVVSLARQLRTDSSPSNPRPVFHGVRTIDHGSGGVALDHFAIDFHGYTTTHLDAICHFWGADGMYNGRDPKTELTFEGATFGSIEPWSRGIVTRGVLLDIPKLRGEPYVTEDQPVHGWDLEDAAAAQDVTIEPGDALVVYCGREAWQAASPDAVYKTPNQPAPGHHASCLEFLREKDVAVLVWDFLDASPSGYWVSSAIHTGIHAFGLALLDNALLEPLAQACADEGRDEFMLTVAPLNIPGGTGSPVNPIALL
jgi:kynurenine formamidase